MPRELFEQPRKGQRVGRFRAHTFNGFSRAARFEREQAFATSRVDDSIAQATANHFRVRNDHTSDVGKFSVLQISGVIVEHSDRADEFLYAPSLKGTRPAATPDAGLWVITQEPIATGKVGWCLAAGCSVVQIDVTDIDHDYADSKASDETKLASADEGAARILYKESGTGTKWGLVRIGDAPAMKPYVDFTLSAALTTSQASKTATVQTQYGAGTAHPTGAAAITVHNLREHTAATYVFEGDSGDYGRAAWYSGTDFLILNLECP